MIAVNRSCLVPELQSFETYLVNISCLVPELQSFEDTKIKVKSADTKQGNQSTSIGINHICDVTYIGCGLMTN